MSAEEGDFVGVVFSVGKADVCREVFASETTIINLVS
jgi:hypothetical protein